MIPFYLMFCWTFILKYLAKKGKYISVIYKILIQSFCNYVFIKIQGSLTSRIFSFQNKKTASGVDFGYLSAGNGSSFSVAWVNMLHHLLSLNQKYKVTTSFVYVRCYGIIIIFLQSISSPTLCIDHFVILTKVSNAPSHFFHSAKLGGLAIGY